MNEYYEEKMNLEIKAIKKAKKNSLSYFGGTIGSSLLYLAVIAIDKQYSHDNTLDLSTTIITMTLYILATFGSGFCGYKTIENIVSLVKHKHKAKLIEKNKNKFFVIY